MQMRFQSTYPTGDNRRKASQRNFVSANQTNIILRLRQGDLSSYNNEQAFASKEAQIIFGVRGHQKLVLYVYAAPNQFLRKEWINFCLGV